MGIFCQVTTIKIYGPTVFLSRPVETLQKGTLIKLSDEKLFTSQTASEKYDGWEQFL